MRGSEVLTTSGGGAVDRDGSLLRGKRILCLSSIDWDFLWQGHQEIMSMLAANGNRVLFVENTGVRRPTVQDFPRLRQRLHNWWRGVKGFRQQQENLFIFSPIILPFPYSRLARFVNRILLLRPLRRWITVTGFYRPIVWTFLPTPLARDLIRELDPECVIYYCIDNFASSSPSARRIARSEEKLFREADLVFVTSEKLRQRAAQFTDRVHVFPFAVDVKKFEEVRNSSEAPPAEVQHLGRPVVGYVGGVHRWIDQELLKTVAKRMPDVAFVLVGPVQTDVAELRRCPNVHLLGARAHDRVPHYIRAFDVGIVPYRFSEYTAHVYPTKLNEYLVMGVPVVATDLFEIRRFNAEHGGILALAHDAESFECRIRQALTERSPAECEQRIEVGRRNSWEVRVGAMSAQIERALTEKQATRRRWEEAIRYIYRGARRRIFVTIVGVAAVYLLPFYTPLIWILASPLHVAEEPTAADAIVVFAGGVGESGKAGGGYQERVKHAVALYDTGLAPRLVFSSGYSFAFQETEVMRELALSLNVPPAAIILEPRAANTVENVAFARDILRRGGWRQVLLVSSPYHMRRALLTWRKIAPDIGVVATPAPYSQFYAHDRGANLEQILGILHEYAGIAYYWWKGWV